MELYWRRDSQAVMERHRAWFSGERRFLITIIPRDWPSFDWDLSINVKTPRPLETFDFTDDAQLDEHLSYRLGQYEIYWRRKAEWQLDDDYLPVFEPRLGWAEHVAAAVEGSQVHLYSQTSAMDPVVEDYDSFDWGRIRFQPGGPAGKILSRTNEWAAEHGRGRFLVMPRGSDANPSDFAKACRGEQFLLDFYLQPDEVHRLMDRCTTACIHLIESQRRTIGAETLGGYGTTWNGGYWTPGRILGHLGDNVADLVSRATYDEFIAPYVRRFAAHFGGAVFARDVTTRQVWGALRGLGDILAFKPRNVGQISVTPTDIRQIGESTDALPLFIEVFSLAELPAFCQSVVNNGIRTFFVVHSRDREEGLRALDAVRGME